MDRNQFSGNMFYYSSWLPQGNPLAMQLIESAWQNWWRQPWSEWITQCHINRKKQHGLAAQNEVLLGSSEKPCKQYHPYNKGGKMSIFLNTILRKSFVKSMLSVQVVALRTPGQCYKTSCLRGSNFMPEESSTNTGCLKQQAPEWKLWLVCVPPLVGSNRQNSCHLYSSSCHSLLFCHLFLCRYG